MSKTAPKAQQGAQANLEFFYRVRDGKSLIPAPDAVFEVSNLHPDYAKEANKPGVSFAPKPILKSTSTFKTLPTPRTPSISSTPSQREVAPGTTGAVPKKVAAIDPSLVNSAPKAPAKAPAKASPFITQTKKASPLVVDVGRNTTVQAVPKSTAPVVQAVPKNKAPAFTFDNSAPAKPKSPAVQAVPKTGARQSMVPKGFSSAPTQVPAPAGAKKAAPRPSTPASPKTAARAPARAFTPVSNKSFRRSQG